MVRTHHRGLPYLIRAGPTMGDATCSEEGCDRPVVARGLCSMDWQRQRKRQGSAWLKPPREKHVCAVDDCPRPVRAKGYCNRHYENLRKYGDPVPQRDRPLEVRLREVGWTVTESGCWEWNGNRNEHGYGLFSAKRLGYDNARAHRVVYAYSVEPIPDDLDLRHECDNPPCVNPDHLIPGTHADNMRDMAERGRRKKRGDTCANGHDVTKPGALKTRTAKSGKTETFCAECDRARKRRFEERKRQVPGWQRRKGGVKSRLSAEQVAEIQAKRAAGVTLKAVAAEYGISVSYACQIGTGSYPWRGAA